MTRVSQQDWLLAGLRVLRDEGDAAINIEKLCAQLDRTKGSFYHHFASFDDFLVELLNLWEHELTAVPINVAGREATTSQRINRLDALVVDLDHALDRAVRAWGLRDERVHRAVVDVDRRRMAYLEQLLRDDGHPEPALGAELEYVAFLGLQHLDALEKPAAKKALSLALRRAFAGLHIR
jgi:AcrR family transcriptional regulator